MPNEWEQSKQLVCLLDKNSCVSLLTHSFFLADAKREAERVAQLQKKWKWGFIVNSEYQWPKQIQISDFPSFPNLYFSLSDPLWCTWQRLVPVRVSLPSSLQINPTDSLPNPTNPHPWEVCNLNSLCHCIALPHHVEHRLTGPAILIGAALTHQGPIHSQGGLGRSLEKVS